MALEYEQDNEFDLVFVVGYQNFLQLSYIGKIELCEKKFEKKNLKNYKK